MSFINILLIVFILLVAAVYVVLIIKSKAEKKLPDLNTMGQKVKKPYTDALDWINRNVLWLSSLIGGSLYLVKLKFHEIVGFSIGSVALAIGLTGFTLFALTKFKFMKEDLKTVAIVIVGVFLGVCIIIGLTTIGFMLAQNVIYALQPTQAITP